MHGVALSGDVGLAVLNAEKNGGEAHDGLVRDLAAGDGGAQGHEVVGFGVCYGRHNKAVTQKVRLGVADVHLEAGSPGRGREREWGLLLRPGSLSMRPSGSRSCWLLVDESGTSRSTAFEVKALTSSADGAALIFSRPLVRLSCESQIYRHELTTFDPPCSTGQATS